MDVIQLWICAVLHCKWTNPIWVVVDVESQVVVHGGDGHVVLHVFGQKSVVDHVEVKRVVELDVDVAHQSSSYRLRISQHWFNSYKSLYSVHNTHWSSLRRALLSLSTHRVQLIPRFIAGCEHGEGAFAFDLLSQLWHVRILLCRRSLHKPQRTIHIVNGSHWEEGRQISQAGHATGIWCWRIRAAYLQGILSCPPASCTQDSIRKGPDFPQKMKQNAKINDVHCAGWQNLTWKWVKVSFFLFFFFLQRPQITNKGRCNGNVMQVGETEESWQINKTNLSSERKKNNLWSSDGKEWRALGARMAKTFETRVHIHPKRKNRKNP